MFKEFSCLKKGRLYGVFLTVKCCICRCCKNDKKPDKFPYIYPFQKKNLPKLVSMSRIYEYIYLPCVFQASEHNRCWCLCVLGS